MLGMSGEWEKKARSDRDRVTHWLAVVYRALREAREAVERGERNACERYRQAVIEADAAVAASELLMLAALPSPSDAS